MPALKFMHIFCELPDKTKYGRVYFIAALGIFVLLAVLFYIPFGTDWQAYGTADWDFSNFMHAVPAWTIKYFHQFPLWDPYLRGGSTLIGNPQNPSPLSVTFLLSLLAGPVAGIKLGVALNAVIGMTGMYMLMEYFDCVWIARILAAGLLDINGTVVYHWSQGHFMWMMTMYWPWMLLFFLKSFDRRIWTYPAALMLGLQFWGGAVYQVAFAVIILALLTGMFAWQKKGVWVFLRFAEIMGAFVVFSAPRLFMVLETLYRFPRVIGNEDTHVPWSVFYYAFICQGQFHNNPVAGLKIDEYSAYVGLVPCVLTALLFFQWRKFWPYLGVLFFSLVMAFGNSPYSPFWPVFHLLGAGYSHFSTRSFLISVFFIAMASGLSLSYLIVRLREKYPIIVFASCLGVAFVLCNLFAVLAPIRQYTMTNARQYENFNPAIPFSQLEVTQKQEYRFANSSMMDRLLRNTGSSNGYDALPSPSYVHARNSPGYRGEFYLQEGFGQIQDISWTPNRWDIKLRVVRPDILVVNQNFDPGWKTGRPRKTLSIGGLQGVVVTPQDHEIVFYYLPFNFILGCWVSVIGLIAMGWDIIKYRA